MVIHLGDYLPGHLVQLLHEDVVKAILHVLGLRKYSAFPLGDCFIFEVKKDSLTVSILSVFSLVLVLCTAQ